MIYGIFTGHNNFAYETVKSCESIIGEQENYSTISNRELSNDEIYEEFQKILKDHSEAKEFFIFIDFYGSSISLPAIKIKQNEEKISIKLIFGYNLPMVIDFFLHRNKLNGEQLYEKIIDVGKRGIR
ncbi:MAG: hypothetical protein ABIN05_01390 [candidate division WOR-3 bacterium]